MQEHRRRLSWAAATGLASDAASGYGQPTLRGRRRCSSRPLASDAHTAPTRSTSVTPQPAPATPRNGQSRATSADEVGSIHTIQGYDLNFAGVIIGDDLRFDPVAERLSFDRGSYYDTKGKENNPRMGRTYDDDDLFRFVTNIYAVLLTRGIRGTYVYATDPALRAYLRRYF
ncbi:MAG: DNA/RNA helicase domain-containing protein [Solirubrobacteraceae bacterium]